MEHEMMNRLHRNFEDYAKIDSDGVEFWYARDLQGLLGYAKWDNFSGVLDKAKLACTNSGGNTTDHFADVGKMVSLGSGSQREIQDVMLTRYACYLVAQNGDPKKEEIAFAQCYFAVQTRKLEVIEERLREVERLSAREKLTSSEREFGRVLYEHGVDEKGIQTIRSKGDTALFGGKSTREMKAQMGIPEKKALADHLPTVTITAKNLATEITNYNVDRKKLCGESPITTEHVQNNSDVRDLLLRRGITPENLPPEEDVKKLERRVRSQEKILAKRTQGFQKDRT